MFPPMLMQLRIVPSGRRGVGLWLPLFLVWLILLPIMVLVLLVTTIVDGVLFLEGKRYHYYTLLLFGCLEMLGTTRGMVVRVRSSEADIDICFA